MLWDLGCRSGRLRDRGPRWPHDRRPPPGRLSGALFIADQLACIRAGRRVFAGVSFALAPGDALLLRGPNGSGKSSLLRMMAGFLRPAAGRLAWHGAPIEIDLATHRRHLCYLGHADAVKGVLTVRENLALA